MDELPSLLIERTCSRLVLLAAEHTDHHGWRIAARQASFLLHG